MDGNRRWARAHNLRTLEGHRRGFEKVKECLRWAKSAGITSVILFAMSTENWNRPYEELSYLMDLLKVVFTKEAEALKKEGVRIRIIGQRERFGKELEVLMRESEAATASNTKLTLGLCLSYGGRAEMLDAVKRLSAGATECTEAAFEKYLWTAGIPDPDLIIRTSGEMRLSGFLPWQSIYSELFFTKTLWPDFNEAEFASILKEYTLRERRVGR